MPRTRRCPETARTGIRLAATLWLLAAPAGRCATPIGVAQTDYLIRCGGCHGIEGVSVPQAVPDLRDHVGLLAATAPGRFYLLHLPNVAMSRLDDASLAAVLNFVVFRLGGASTRPETRPFTAAEVHAAIASGVIPSDLPALRATALAAAASARPDRQ